MRPCGTLLFLVVVTRFNEHIVALFHLREGFFKTLCSDESVGALAAFGIVGNGNLIVEVLGNNLTPAGPGFIVLVYNGAVAAQEYCGYILGGGLYGYAFNCRCGTVEFSVS